MPEDSDSPGADLKLVDEGGRFEEESDSRQSDSQAAGRATDEPTPRSLPIWLFVVGLILAVIVIGWQAQLAGELEAEVAGLEMKLERTNALLEAHRSHLGEIRGGVYDLSERLDSLRALVDERPGSGLGPASPRTPPTP